MTEIKGSQTLFPCDETYIQVFANYERTHGVQFIFLGPNNEEISAQNALKLKLQEKDIFACDKTYIK